MDDDRQRAFVEVAEAEVDALRRFAAAVAGDGHRGDDLVQGAFERLWAAWPRTGRLRDPGAYLRRCVVHRAVSESRRPWRRERSTAVHPETAPGGGGEHAAASAVRLDLARALAGLTVKQRAVVVMRYLEDRPIAEVADVLGVSTGTVKRQSSDAVATLRRTLGEDFLDDGPDLERRASAPVVTAADEDGAPHPPWPRPAPATTRTGGPPTARPGRGGRR